MNTSKPSIVFMGTPEFAVASLKILHENDYPIVGVVTATDKWGGRNKSTLICSAVKSYALEHHLPVLQPKNLKDPQFIEALEALQADLQVVVAFRMLPKAVWSMPKLGTINLHASLLPKFRGAAPINWAIIRGETETGVTTFFIQEEIDTGDLLFQDRVPISPTDTAGTLHDRLMDTGAQLLLQTVQAIEKNEFTPLPQSHEDVSFAPKIFHETCAINFGQTTQQVFDFIRGLSPYPGAWTFFLQKEMKVYEANPSPELHDQQPGTIATDGKKYLKVATLDGWINLVTIQMPGKKRMSVETFLNGLRLTLDQIKSEKILYE